MKGRIIIIAVLGVILALGSQAMAAPIYSCGFESGEGYTKDQTIDGQNGWVMAAPWRMAEPKDAPAWGGATGDQWLAMQSSFDNRCYAPTFDTSAHTAVTVTFDMHPESCTDASNYAGIAWFREGGVNMTYLTLERTGVNVGDLIMRNSWGGPLDVGDWQYEDANTTISVEVTLYQFQFNNGTYRSWACNITGNGVTSGGTQDFAGIFTGSTGTLTDLWFQSGYSSTGGALTDTLYDNILVVPKLLIPGDANLDDEVELADLQIVSDNWGMTSGATWGDGDFTGDEAVELADLQILSDHWGEHAPEPATMALLLIGLPVLMRRRKRNRN